MAAERGIELIELKDTFSDEFTELVTVRIESGEDTVEVAGTAVGPRNLPHLVRVWGASTCHSRSTSRFSATRTSPG